MAEMTEAAPQPATPAGAVPDFTDLLRHAALLTGCAAAYVALGQAGRCRIAAAHGADPAQLDTHFADAVLQAASVLERADATAGLCAGAPITSAEGLLLGALCVADATARELTAMQRQDLAALAHRAAMAMALETAESALRAAHDHLELDFNAALDSMADGVLTIGSGGALRAINAAAANMLGVDAEKAIGATLQDLLPEDGSDELLDAILAPISAEEPPGRQTIGFGGRRLAVLSHAYRMRLGPQAGRVALTASLTDVTEAERLAEAEAALGRDLAEQHRKLQSAYLELEHSAARIQQGTRRLRAARFAGVAGLALLLLGLGAYAWLPGTDWGQPALPAAGLEATAIVPQPVSSRIAVVGLLDAGAVVSVVGPFDGIVEERLFRYGGQVERGAPLLRLDRKEVEVRLREARSAEIRARQRVTELRNWENGFEVARARRGLAAAQLEAADINARAAQTRMLLSRGIIAADEHRALVQQQRNQQLQAQAAQHDLDSTLARGDAQTLRIAELELANAEVKVQELETDLAHSTVLAPVSGVVLMPPEASGGGAGGGRRETIEVGSRVSRGQTMFTIGALESFQVRATVDEIDVNKLRVGQAVAVTGDAFGDTVLEGRVTSVAAQAGSDTSGRGGMPSFPVTVAIDSLTAEQRAQLAVGMSASLSIITYDKPDAFVLPPHLIRMEGGQRIVRLRRNGQERDVPVVLGISTPEGVEIRSGLEAGDVVLP